MVTQSHGNIEPNNLYSNSIIKKKYYTPQNHNILFDGFYCTEKQRFAMYHYAANNLRIPCHYFSSIFKQIKVYTQYAPHHMIVTDTSIFIPCKRPVLRPINAPPRKYVPKHRPYRFIEPRFN